jgi:hypothetical protein
MTGSAPPAAYRAASGSPVPRPALWAAQAAFVVVGMGYAAVSVYWGLRGSWQGRYGRRYRGDGGPDRHGRRARGGLGRCCAEGRGRERALARHAYLWDPWFLGWGLLVLVALVTTRPAVSGVT